MAHSLPPEVPLNDPELLSRRIAGYQSSIMACNLALGPSSDASQEQKLQAEEMKAELQRRVIKARAELTALLDHLPEEAPERPVEEPPPSADEDEPPSPERLLSDEYHRAVDILESLFAADPIDFVELSKLSYPIFKSQLDSIRLGHRALERGFSELHSMIRIVQAREFFQRPLTEEQIALVRQVREQAEGLIEEEEDASQRLLEVFIVTAEQLESAASNALSGLLSTFFHLWLRLQEYPEISSEVSAMADFLKLPVSRPLPPEDETPINDTSVTETEGQTGDRFETEPDRPESPKRDELPRQGDSPVEIIQAVTELVRAMNEGRGDLKAGSGDSITRTGGAAEIPRKPSKPGRGQGAIEIQDTVVSRFDLENMNPLKNCVISDPENYKPYTKQRLLELREEAARVIVKKLPHLTDGDLKGINFWGEDNPLFDYLADFRLGKVKEDRGNLDILTANAIILQKALEDDHLKVEDGGLRLRYPENGFLICYLPSEAGHIDVIRQEATGGRKILNPRH